MKTNCKLILIGMFLALFGCGGTSDEPDAKSSIVQTSSEGEQIVSSRCVACHANGINGAPIIGNSKMWGPRLTKGKDQLVANAINGFELMPAKGGQTDLSDAQIGMAVEFMISQVK